jgi:hypothetical protein
VSGWDFADVWVYASLAGTGPTDGASLTQIILYGDALNHALLLESEFTAAFGRLRAAGLAEGDAAADRYWLTGKGSALRAEFGFRGLVGWLDVVPRALATVSVPEAEPWPLPPDAFDNAVREYLVA